MTARLFSTPQAQLTTDDYYTPRWVFDAMGITFDLDVCSPPGGIPWLPTRRYLTMEDDGLESDWDGCVWMNPPYSEAWRWVPKFIAHRHGVALLPHAKSGWHPTIWRAADAIVSPDRFVKFESTIGTGDVRFPVFFAAFGAECVDAISRLGLAR